MLAFIMPLPRAKLIIAFAHSVTFHWLVSSPKIIQGILLRYNYVLGLIQLITGRNITDANPIVISSRRNRLRNPRSGHHTLRPYLRSQQQGVRRGLTQLHRRSLLSSVHVRFEIRSTAGRRKKRSRGQQGERELALQSQRPPPQGKVGARRQSRNTQHLTTRCRTWMMPRKGGGSGQVASCLRSR